MKNLILILLLAISTALSAQEFDQPIKISPLEADRPDQTETPSLVPKGMFQMENGFVYERTGRQGLAFLAPSSLLKFGVNENFELRMIVEYSGTEILGNRNWGLDPIKLGLKAKLAEEHGLVPKTSIIAHMSLPSVASSDRKTTYYAPEFRFVMQHTLTPSMSLSYNLGAEWNGEQAEPTFIYTLATGFSLTEKLGMYMELYGFAPQEDRADHRFGGGYTYLITDDFMIDASGGFGISEHAPEYYTSLGFSFRF
jgi:hypothetical protein